MHKYNYIVLRSPTKDKDIRASSANVKDQEERL